MSNLIKASQISYKEEIRAIDMNERAQEVEARYLDSYIANNIVAKQISFSDVAEQLNRESALLENPEEETGDGFSEGIPAKKICNDDWGIDDVIAGEAEGAKKTGAGAPAAEAAAPGAVPSEAEAVHGADPLLASRNQELAELEARIAEARKEAESIIAEAQAEADQLRENAELEVQEKAAAAMEQAREEGLEQGRAQAQEECDRIKEELEEQKLRYKEDYEKQVDELEPAFVEILVKYVQKLTGIYADDKREIVLHLIEDAMKNRHGVENFIVRVSSADFETVSNAKEEIRQYLSEGSQLEIVEDKLLEPTQCMIETESRIFDCSLEGQLDNLIEDIRLLAEKE